MCTWCPLAHEAVSVGWRVPGAYRPRCHVSAPAQNVQTSIAPAVCVLRTSNKILRVVLHVLYMHMKYQSHREGQYQTGLRSAQVALAHPRVAATAHPRVIPAKSVKSRWPTLECPRCAHPRVAAKAELSDIYSSACTCATHFKQTLEGVSTYTLHACKVPNPSD